MRAYAKYFAIFTMIFLITGSNAFPQVGDIFHPSQEKEKLIAALKYSQVDTEEDTGFFYSKRVRRAFLMSLAVPGAGEFYSGSELKAAVFAGLEASFWALYFTYNSKGNRLVEEYKKFADEHWDLKRWYLDGLLNDLTGLKDSRSETHVIWIEYGGQEYPAIDDSLDIYFPGEWEDMIKHEEFEPVKDDEYYENIGKYDQFASGWDDFLEYNERSDTLFMSPNRDKYLSMRWDANKAFEVATAFVSAIMFNHVISAFDALITAKHKEAADRNKFSWNMAIITDYRYKNPVRGIRLSVAF